MVKDRQVSKFNRLLHKNNINGNLDGAQQSPQLADNNHKTVIIIVKHKVIHVTIIIRCKVLAVVILVKVING